jgi:hypothetical protein
MKYKFKDPEIKISTDAGVDFYTMVCELVKTGKVFEAEPFDKDRVLLSNKHGHDFVFPKEWLSEVPNSRFENWLHVYLSEHPKSYSGKFSIADMKNAFEAGGKVNPKEIQPLIYAARNVVLASDSNRDTYIKKLDILLERF